VKTFTEMKGVLKATGNGKMTIALDNPLDVVVIRTKHSDICANLSFFSLKPKKGIHTDFIKANNINAYNALTGIISGYKLLDPKGHLMPATAS
jgi:hypothetical protein